MSESPVDLLKEWVRWWMFTDNTPAKLPHALHVRTAVWLAEHEERGTDMSYDTCDSVCRPEEGAHSLDCTKKRT